jgi:hypothetical protein
MFLITAARVEGVEEVSRASVFLGIDFLYWRTVGDVRSC